MRKLPQPNPPRPALWAAPTTPYGPALLLKKALELPPNSVLFFIVPKNDMVEAAAVIQGIANLRNEFKATRRTLVILARDVALPPFLADDVPVLRNSLPGPDEIKSNFKRVLAPFRENTVYQTATEQVDKVADLRSRPAPWPANTTRRRMSSSSWSTSSPAAPAKRSPRASITITTITVTRNIGIDSAVTLNDAGYGTFKA